MSDGNESAPGAGVERFAPAIERVREHGGHVAVHAGESGDAVRMRRSLGHLRPDRVDHGIRAVEDDALVADLAQRGTPLAVCLTSNVTLGVVSGLDDHPVRRLLAAGVVVTLNTDDPELFGTSLVDEYALAATHFGWTTDELGALARASIMASTAGPDRRNAVLHELDLYLAPEPSSAPVR